MRSKDRYIGILVKRPICLFFDEVRRPARVELWGCGRKTNVVGSARVCAHTGCVSVGNTYTPAQYYSMLLSYLPGPDPNPKAQTIKCLAIE